MKIDKNELFAKNERKKIPYKMDSKKSPLPVRKSTTISRAKNRLNVISFFKVKFIFFYIKTFLYIILTLPKKKIKFIFKKKKKIHFEETDCTILL